MVKQVTRIDFSCWMNDSIDKDNYVIDEWEGLYGPIKTAEAGSLKASKLDKTNGALCHHVMIGMIISALA